MGESVKVNCEKEENSSGERFWSDVFLPVEETPFCWIAPVGESVKGNCEKEEG